jgi:riboflavin synthase
MRIGIADTMFARADMGKVALDTINEKGGFEVERYTVPGFKDLPVACKRLIEEWKCDIVLALAWVGSMPIDEKCAEEANIALMNAELMTNRHILKVFVHSKEAEEKQELMKIAVDRTMKHTLNAIDLLKGKEELTPRAGKGQRQGGKHKGEL